MTLVFVDRDALAKLIREHHRVAWDAHPFGLRADDPIVTLAVQARLPLPGSLEPGAVPPAPVAGLYREPGDNRLRCEGCGKVVFDSMGSAQAAADRITRSRQEMKAYRGDCGHYHVSRVKGGLRSR